MEWRDKRRPSGGTSDGSGGRWETRVATANGRGGGLMGSRTRKAGGDKLQMRRGGGRRMRRGHATDAAAGTGGGCGGCRRVVQAAGGKGGGCGGDKRGEGGGGACVSVRAATRRRDCMESATRRRIGGVYKRSTVAIYSSDTEARYGGALQRHDTAA